MKLPIPSNLVRRLRRVGVLNPARHQGKRELSRRLKQIRAGQLTGQVVSEEARYSAHGLVGPNALTLVKRG